MPFRILIVDDETDVCRSLSELLAARGYEVGWESSPRCAAARVETERFDLLITDLRMPELGGLDLIKLLRKKRPDLEVIVFSGYATVENAVRAMKYGARNLFTKPIKIPLLVKEIEQVRESASRRERVDEGETLVGADERMDQLLRVIATVAPTDAPVLVTGESGTGKELIANTIHSKSQRAGAPCVKINCASIPESLMESEIFGHEAGAFTDAKERKKGLFELASGGTLFLDEIGEMSPRTQAKMLRVLQDGKFLRVGGTEFQKADCRIVAATNRNLEDCIRAGTFREDLYYRLSVISIRVPPLRERPKDILPLARHFLSRFASIYGKKAVDLAPEVEAILVSHDWPGNIRELKNFMERAVIFTPGESVGLEAIPEQYLGIAPMEGSCDDPYQRVDGAAREIILEALTKSGGVRQEAARMLRIDRKTLYNRMKRFNLT